jgi:hypothetical protein
VPALRRCSPWPLALALLHQLGAVTVLIAAVIHLRRMWPAMPVATTATA